MINQLKYMLEDGLVAFFKTLSTSSDLYSILVVHKRLVLQLHMNHWKILHMTC
jgi:hypothetical protein